MWDAYSLFNAYGTPIRESIACRSKTGDPTGFPPFSEIRLGSRALTEAELLVVAGQLVIEDSRAVLRRVKRH